MLIAIDYDETYTLDEDFWNSFINLATHKHHEVLCVTCRYPHEGNPVKKSIGKYCDIYFTSRKAKKDYLRKLGIFPDVWIDDAPHWILKDAKGE